MLTTQPLLAASINFSELVTNDEVEVDLFAK